MLEDIFEIQNYNSEYLLIKQKFIKEFNEIDWWIGKSLSNM